MVIDQFHMGGGASRRPSSTALRARRDGHDVQCGSRRASGEPRLGTWRRIRGPCFAMRWHYALMRRFLKPLHTKINAQRGAWGLARHASFPNDCVCRPSADIPAATELRVSQARTASRLSFCRSAAQWDRARLKTDFPRERLDGRPIIYASMGTLQNGLEWIFRVILEACAGLDAQLVLSLGGNMDPAAFSGTAGNAVVVRFAPQLELLERATLCITHAGLNTALESLACGVPMVAIPITNDQPGAAARIAWCGAGEFVTPETADRLLGFVRPSRKFDLRPPIAKTPSGCSGRSAGLTLPRLCQ